MAMVYEVKWSVKQRFPKEGTETVVVFVGTDYNEMKTLCAYLQKKNPTEHYWVDVTVVDYDAEPLKETPIDHTV